MPAFLEAISAGDLGVFLNGQDFIAVQSMNEKFGQEVTYRSSFGQLHPNIRTKRASDEIPISFSFLLLKSGVDRGLNSYQVLRALSDFEVQTKKGEIFETYVGCNWTNISIDSGMDSVTVTIDITAPGFVNE